MLDESRIAKITSLAILVVQIRNICWPERIYSHPLPFQWSMASALDSMHPWGFLRFATPSLASDMISYELLKLT